MKRVLLVSEAQAVGGAEIYLERLALHLRAFEPRLAVPRALGAWTGRLKQQGLSVVNYGSGAGGLAGLFRAAREASLIHVNLPSTYDGSSGWLPWLLHWAAPVVVTEHLTLLPRSRRREAFKRLTSSAVKARICVSEASAAPLRWGPVRVIANAVPDPGEPRPPKPGNLRIGSLATLEPRKRLDVLIDAMAGLPGAELHLAGEGPQRGDLEARARDSGAGARIHFLGRVGDPYAFIRDMHLLALSSDLEAMPLSVLEALASGRGVVCRDLPGMSELVTPACGLLVDTDDPARWAEVLRSLSAKEIRDMGAAARRRYLEAFTPSRWVQDTEAVYHDILGTSP